MKNQKQNFFNIFEKPNKNGLTKKEFDLLIEDVYKLKNSNEICKLCNNTFKEGDKIKILRCNHFFHIDELQKYLKDHFDCPQCHNFIDFSFYLQNK